MVEWVNENTEKKWIRIENIVSRTKLHTNIWVPRKYRTLGQETHDLTTDLFKIRDTLYRQKKWVYNSPLIALTGTNFFA